MKTHPTFGNLIIEERATSVALRLRTDNDGVALFTYREIALLASTLAHIKEPPAPTGPAPAGAFA